MGAVLVFVDDDNVLFPDYLETAWRIHRDRPYLGAFGGITIPEFEVPPPAWIGRYAEMLGIRDVPVSVWSNDINHWASTPIGAGLCVRRDVALHYVGLLHESPLRRALDRRGSSLVSGGDNNLAYCAVALGYGMGVFRELRLTHSIPAARLSREYLNRLSEAIGFSAVILDALWNREGFTESGFPSIAEIFRRGWRILRDRVRDRAYVAARRRGAARARLLLAAMAAECKSQMRRVREETGTGGGEPG